MRNRHDDLLRQRSRQAIVLLLLVGVAVLAASHAIHPWLAELAARAALPCLEPGRADLIVPGSAICLEAFDRLGFGAFVVSDRGLREGILCEILSEG